MSHSPTSIAIIRMNPRQNSYGRMGGGSIIRVRTALDDPVRTIPSPLSSKQMVKSWASPTADN